MSVLSSVYGVCIDRAIGCPGHGKDIVDALNAVEKWYFSSKMMTTSTPEVNSDQIKNARVASHSMQEGKSFSLAKEAKRILNDPSRVHGVKSDKKYKKREAASKLMDRIYHVEGKVDFQNIKRRVVGLPPGEHNGILGRYNLWTDPDLGMGWAALRHVPCGCPTCVKQLQEPWDDSIKDPQQQPRYKQNKECHRWPIFEGLNDWIIVSIVKDAKSNAKEEEAAKKSITDDLAVFVSQEIKVGGYGAMAVDEGVNGYYIVQWTGEPYMLQERVEFPEYNPPMILEPGELVCDAEYLHAVGSSKYWYTHPVDEHSKRVSLRTTVRLIHVVAPDLELHPLSNDNRFPANMARSVKSKAQEGERKPMSVSVENHDDIVNEIVRRETIAFDDDIEGSDTEDEDSEAEESEDEQGDN